MWQAYEAGHSEDREATLAGIMDLPTMREGRREKESEGEMLTPEATLKLMEEGYWGAKAMERRVIKCCADNPGCPFKERCLREYDKLVDRSEVPSRTDQPGYKRNLTGKLLNYHLLRKAGFSSREAAKRMTNKQTAMALEMAGMTT